MNFTENHLDRLVKAAEHYTKCPRCLRLLRTAVGQVDEGTLQELRRGEETLGIVNLDEVLLLEFRNCPDWPKGL